MGILADSELETYYTDGMRLPAHPPAGIFDCIPFATGSLGHGLSQASGLALSRRMRRARGRVDCFCSDGEWQEGSTWEALILACHHKLSNLTVMVEYISC